MFYVDTILLIIIAMGLLIGLVMLATVSLHLARTCHILDRVTKASEEAQMRPQKICTLEPINEVAPETEEANDKLNEDKPEFGGLIEAINDIMLGDEHEQSRR